MWNFTDVLLWQPTQTVELLQDGHSFLGRLRSCCSTARYHLGTEACWRPWRRWKSWGLKNGDLPIVLAILLGTMMMKQWIKRATLFSEPQEEIVQGSKGLHFSMACWNVNKVEQGLYSWTYWKHVFFGSQSQVNLHKMRIHEVQAAETTPFSQWTCSWNILQAYKTKHMKHREILFSNLRCKGRHDK